MRRGKVFSLRPIGGQGGYPPPTQLINTIPLGFFKVGGGGISLDCCYDINKIKMFLKAGTSALPDIWQGFFLIVTKYATNKLI